MGKVLINIEDESKMEVLVNFLKSLDYISLENIEEVSLSAEQKRVLDHRRDTAKPEDFIPWEEAKKSIKTRDE